MLTHKWWAYYQLKGFKLTNMALWNNSSLANLVNDEKFIDF